MLRLSRDTFRTDSFKRKKGESRNPTGIAKRTNLKITTVADVLIWGTAAQVKGRKGAGSWVKKNNKRLA
jgi:hypothetical protein